MRLIVLLNLGFCVPLLLEVLAATWTTGLGAVGADTLLVILGPGSWVLVPGVANDIVAVVVIGVAVVGFVGVGPTLPTGYKLMLWPFSPSGAFEETVDVPVVPDPGDGCILLLEQVGRN